MPNPELGSKEFFDKFYPESVAESTVNNVSRLIANLTTYLLSTNNRGLDGWLHEKINNPIRWKERFLFLRRFSGVYWNFNDSKYNAHYQKILEEQNAGVNQTVRPQNSNEAIMSEFEKLDKYMERARKGPITLETLFGVWLPPRRLDVYELFIVDNDTDEDVNYYNRNTRTFVFNVYKNEKSKGQQRFKIESLAPLYKDKSILPMVIKFLNNRPIGKLYPWAINTISTLIPKWYGTSNSTLRKYWSTRYDKNGTKGQRLLLSKWMDHDTNVVLKNYVIESNEFADLSKINPSDFIGKPINSDTYYLPKDYSHINLHDLYTG